MFGKTNTEQSHIIKNSLEMKLPSYEPSSALRLVWNFHSVSSCKCFHNHGTFTRVIGISHRKSLRDSTIHPGKGLLSSSRKGGMRTPHEALGNIAQFEVPTSASSRWVQHLQGNRINERATSRILLHTRVMDHKLHFREICTEPTSIRVPPIASIHSLNREHSPIILLNSGYHRHIDLLLLCTSEAPSGTTSTISPCFCPDLMYSTNPEIVQLGMASWAVTTEPFICEGLGPSWKFPLGSKPAYQVVLFIEAIYQTHSNHEFH
ncbi:uncharacterized protein G2W53_000194 [Senna tora]|uniref:Uncharacterized protein n=1 Tax=Senna tora TaxID=362788 RepID=A0A834XF81_9FABA|nr:uncharacterized protein G2W53_000194 [Senna tora]